METSAIVHVPWVGYAMAGLAAVSIAGLAGVAVGYLRAQGAGSVASGTAPSASGHRVIEPLTPAWLERLITGAGVPPGPRPLLRDPASPERDVA
ncbi:MAG: hypothetical protein U1F08_01025 [Steroidobacteraceae bacterium]